MSHEQAARASHAHTWQLMGSGPRALYGCVECGLEGNRAMWARHEALEARIAQAQEQMTAARTIVEAVAKLEPWDCWWYECDRAVIPGGKHDHAARCPVTLARVWLGEGKSTG